MPIYEYKCPECGVFEVTQRITADPLEDCPTCQSTVRKLISNTSFQLKGTGWYVTDYGRGKGANEENRETNGGKDSSDSDKATESKSTETKSTESKKSEKSSSGDNATSTA
jgi:putative FmdB family regulatory protein